MTEDTFFAHARKTYLNANETALAWMLDRPFLRGAFLNTKQNSLTLKDYDESDGWRGPQFIYGWIQGRGLEALATHARFFETTNPALTGRLDDVGRRLYAAVSELVDRFGHIYFCYDVEMNPVRPGREGEILRQSRPNDLFTYSDAFAAKGLVAGANRYDSGSTAKHIAYLGEVVSSIEEGRFVLDERRKLNRTNLALQPDEYGPRMIVLGAAALLRQLGMVEAADFGDRFISHVLERHRDAARSGSKLLRDTPGGDHCNPGHAIEFSGFALASLPEIGAADLVERMIEILKASFEAGFRHPGLCLSISVKTGQLISPYFPWWSLPETIRACALTFERTRDSGVLAIWQRAHEAFFTSYWRAEPPIAFQTRNAIGPVDYVPATPDLDPGFHTGQSLLGAIESIDRMSTQSTALKTRDT